MLEHEAGTTITPSKYKKELFWISTTIPALMSILAIFLPEKQNFKYALF